MTYEVEFEMLPVLYERLLALPNQVTRTAEIDKVSATLLAFIFQCLDVVDEAKEYVTLHSSHFTLHPLTLHRLIRQITVVGTAVSSPDKTH